MAHKFYTELTATRGLTDAQKVKLAYELGDIDAQLYQDGTWTKAKLTKLNALLSKYPVIFYMFLLGKTDPDDNLVFIFNLQKEWIDDELKLLPFAHLPLSTSPKKVHQTFEDYRHKIVDVHRRVFNLESIVAQKRIDGSPVKKSTPAKVAPKKVVSTPKKTTPKKKTVAKKKVAPKKTPVKKTSVKKTSVTKMSVKKPTKKVSVKKVAAKKKVTK